ncbi:3-keto-5-aminohexanoate cleavage protein [Aeromicrobium sp. UC242_57]|uniref:3-keto-5-aminohexanoate cleavage protein n=1 Tax=Aeromicrobium sp. UC242_57 TaxID=3374624 RepID=UPI0037A1463A
MSAVGKPLVIGVNVNENTMRAPNPHVPWTAEEIAQTAAEAEQAGATLMHFHARTPDGGADHTAGGYAEVVRAVRRRSRCCWRRRWPTCLATASTSGWPTSPPNQDDPETSVDLLPIDMGSATMDLFDPAAGEYATDDRVFVNSTAQIAELMRRAPQLGLTPYLASFNLSWTRAILAHHAAGRLPASLAVVLVLGGEEFVAAHPTTAAGVRAHVDLFPPDLPVEWLVSSLPRGRARGGGRRHRGWRPRRGRHRRLPPHRARLPHDP